MKTVSYIFVFLLALWLIFRSGLTIDDKPPQVVEVVKADTITVIKTDTVRVLQPVPQVVEVIRRDTVRVNDTVILTVPIERKTYQNSTYKATVTGYNPALEDVEVYPRTVTNTVTQTQTVYKYIPKKWGVGLSAGYGITTTDLRLSPYVGISINYNLFCW